jgi:hypothetical protein
LSLLPQRALTNVDIERYTAHLPNFRGIFMRDALPSKPHRNESGIINLDISRGSGTHWVAYQKQDSNVVYFDSYGNLQPPEEVINYFSGNKIFYNHDNYQGSNPYNCGHLALKFLYDKLK